MKESIGGTQLFIIVIVIILLFTAIISFTISRSNAFAIKDTIITEIEKREKFDSKTVKNVIDILQKNSYHETGNCSKNNMGKGYTRDGKETTGDDASFCVKTFTVKDNTGFRFTKTNYKVTVFYGIDVPIINEFFKFTLVGETRTFQS